MILKKIACVLQAVSRMPFYAVRVGRTPGIYATWDECQREIDKFPSAKYKKFSTEADAASFINEGKNSPAMKSAPASSAKPSSKTTVKNAVTSTKSELSTDSSSTVKSPKDKQNKKEALSSVRESDKDSLSKLEKEIAACEVELFSEWLTHQENEERLQLKEQNLEQMKERLELAKSAGGKIKTAKTASGRQTTPYSRPTGTSSSNWSQGRTTKLIDLDEARQIHTSSGNNCEDVGGNSVPIVFTDGACVNNGRGNPRAGIGVYWGPDHPLNVSERLSGRQTNNRAEIYAVVKAAEQARKQGLSELIVKTDSQFLINSMTKWVPSWQKKGWKTAAGSPVINKEDFEDLIEASKGLMIHWVHVKGHQGVEGNECADKLAVQGAALDEC